jgi:hypothetical protein
MPEVDNDVCCIESTLDDSGNAACLLRWGRIRALLTPSVVLAPARDLMAAAIAAETDTALVAAFREELRADDQMVGTVLTEVRARRPAPPAPAALRTHAVAGARTGKPLVHIGRGSMRGELTPDEAREMAVHWIQAATAAQIDVRLRYALGEWGRLNVVEIEQLFALIQGVGR